MRCLIVRLPILFFLLILVSSASSSCAVYCQSIVKSEANQNNPASESIEQQRRYRREVAGQAFTENWGIVSFITLESSDGMRFTKYSIDWTSAKRANKELRKVLKKASKIVSTLCRRPIYAVLSE